MRLGKVKLLCEYAVDLDNPEMVEAAKRAVYEDLMNAVKYNEVDAYINVFKDIEHTSFCYDEVLMPCDIPDFLKEKDIEI